MPEPAARAWLGHFGVGVAIAIGATLAAVGLGGTAFVTRVELATYDWRMRLTARPSEPSSDIVVVAMNDDSIKRLEPVVGRWPWPRLVHASVIDFLARSPARVIVFDGLFIERDTRRFDVAGEEWTGAESDRALAESVAKAGMVVLGADANDEGLEDASKQIMAPLDGILALAPRREGSDCVEPRPILVPPYAELAKAARGIGHTYTILDADVRAIQKNKSIQMGVDEKVSGNAALLNRLVENVYLDIVEKGFGRGEEMESDEKAVMGANKIGYAPQGLSRFLLRLQERNKASKEKRGLFASHPEMK